MKSATDLLEAPVRGHTLIQLCDDLDALEWICKCLPPPHIQTEDNQLGCAKAHV